MGVILSIQVSRQLRYGVYIQLQLRYRVYIQLQCNNEVRGFDGGLTLVPVTSIWIRQLQTFKKKQLTEKGYEKKNMWCKKVRYSFCYVQVRPNCNIFWFLVSKWDLIGQNCTLYFWVWKWDLIVTFFGFCLKVRPNWSKSKKKVRPNWSKSET